MSTHEPDLRAAYRAAWSDRQATGDTSDDVLLRQLRLHGVDLSPARAGALETTLGFWRRGVTPRRLTWEVAKLGGRAARKAGRAYWELTKSLYSGGFATPVPFEATLGKKALSDLLREDGDVDDGGGAAFEIWFDVRTLSAPNALVMLGDDVIGRSRIPDSEHVDLQAAARDDQFATGLLEVEASGGLLLVDRLEYVGLTDGEIGEDAGEGDED